MGRELKEKESQTACCTGDLFHTHVKRRTGKVLGQCCPRSAQQPAHALPEGGTHRQDMTQNMRCAEVCCICKTTGILGESCSVSLACLPDSAQRRGKRKWVYLCDPMPGYACEGGNREKTRAMGKLHVPRDLRRVGDRQAPGAVQGLLVFRVQTLGSSGPAKDTPWSVLKVLT